MFRRKKAHPSSSTTPRRSRVSRTEQTQHINGHDAPFSVYDIIGAEASESSLDDEGSGRSLTKLSSEERESSNHRPQALERRSMNSQHVSAVEASKFDLSALIDKREWKHVLRIVGNDPSLISERQTAVLDGVRTRALPLHLAVSNKPPLNVVDAMVTAYLDACKVQDDVNGQLPLHIACKFRASSEVLKCIIESYPDAVRYPDRRGRLPLHYACLDGSPYDISMLISVEKRTLLVKDVDGKTPVDLARKSKSLYRDQILKRIYEVSKSVDRQTRTRKRKEKTELLAPGTPAYKQQEPPTVARVVDKSPSERTVTTSNLTTEKPHGAKSKNKLPAWARGRRVVEADFDRRAVESSAPVRPRSSGKKFESIPTGAFSLPEPKENPNALSMDSNSSFGRRNFLPVIDSKGELRASMNTMGLHADSATPLDNTEATLMASSLYLDESMDVMGSPPCVRRQKKKGLSTSADLMAFLSNEKRSALTEELRNQSAPLPSLPLIFSSTDDQTSPMSKSMPIHYSGHQSVASIEDTTLNASLPVSRMSEKTLIHTGYTNGSPNLSTSSPSSLTTHKELLRLDAQLHRLELQKAALVQQCTHVSETILQKREAVVTAREKIHDLSIQIANLQHKLKKEEAALDFAQSRIKLHEEILCEHEDRINVADLKIAALTSTRNELLREMANL